jgi:hypothetical protein
VLPEPYSATCDAFVEPVFGNTVTRAPWQGTLRLSLIADKRHYVN